MIYTKSIIEIITQRFSCRSYLEHPIDDERRRRLADFASLMKRGPFGNLARFELVANDGQDGHALRKLGTYGFIKGATGFIVGALRPGERNLEDFGYLMESILLYATDIGLGTCWLGGTFTKSSFAEKISVCENELVPAVASVGYIAKRPRRVDALIRRGATADRRLPWEQLFFDTRLGAPLRRDAAGDYAAPLEMVRLAPSASNKQPWRIVNNGSAWHFYLQRTPGYRERRLVRLFTVADLQRIDMGIAMSHFELAACELGLHGRWTSEGACAEQCEGVEYTVSWVTE